MDLLCVLGRRRWATVENPGEEPYQWCQRCQRYPSNARSPDAAWRTAERGPLAGRDKFGGGAGHGGNDGFDSGGGHN